MKDHRIRLNDEELWMVIVALRARIPALRGKGRAKMERLLVRLDNGSAGNPNWILGLAPGD